MSESFPVVECTIETMDRTLYASREVGDLVDSGDFILNTALYYAFGFTSGRYVNKGNQPSYIEDTAGIHGKMYITPAKPEPAEEYMRRIWGSGRAGLHIGGHSVSCWNARPHRYAVKIWSAQEDPDKGRNLPKFGRERVLDQQNIFTAYILLYDVDAESVEIPRYIRIGKKRSKARVTTKIVECELEEGEFLSNHPFGIYDYEGVPIGDLVSVRMRPVPLIIQARYRGMYVRIPDSSRGDVVLPYKLEFLKNKR